MIKHHKQYHEGDLVKVITDGFGTKTEAVFRRYLNPFYTRCEVVLKATGELIDSHSDDVFDVKSK